MRDQIIDTVGDAVKDAGRDLALRQLTVRVGLAVATAIRRKLLRDRTLNECLPLASIAEALMGLLRDRHDATPDDVERRLAVLEMVARLCADHDLRADWLRRSLFELPGMGLVAERLPEPDGSTWIGQLARFFNGYRDRTRLERAAYFRDLLSLEQSPDVARATRLFLSYALRDLGRAEEALVELQALLEAEPDSSLLRYQGCRTLLTLRRFDDFEQRLRLRPPTEETEVRRLTSDLAWERGDLATAVIGPRLRAARLRSAGRHRVALENESAALWRSAVAGDAGAHECEELINQSDLYGLRLTMRTALAAKALLLLPDDAAVAGVMNELEAARTEEESTGWREWTVAVLRALRLGDEETVARIGAEAAPAGRSRGANWVPLDRALRYAGHRSIFPPVGPMSAGWHAAVARLVT
ncbi:hypothetical protein [Symbioplanes lichenis]|uniref:hypothetical protein n=1 Tax=Symbioplanes lichenis TaxID=1629072 RepID=UPI00273A075D|nr:hypothetical protein [Actinoplanes lichenis]